MGKKPLSRLKRWVAAAQKADAQRDLLRSAAEGLAAAANELYDVQQAYVEWRDNLPDNMQSGALYDKLNTVCDMDIESLIDPEGIINDLGVLDDALDADLPLGFGRD